MKPFYQLPPTIYHVIQPREELLGALEFLTRILVQSVVRIFKLLLPFSRQKRTDEFGHLLFSFIYAVVAFTQDLGFEFKESVQGLDVRLFVGEKAIIQWPMDILTESDAWTTT